MNILFVLYGSFNTNSAIPISLYARELQRTGHHCAIAIPEGLDTARQLENVCFIPVLYEDVLADPSNIFPDRRPADIIHACTPRENVRHFITAYQTKNPTPLIISLEDNERWISEKVLDINTSELDRMTGEELSAKLVYGLSHPFHQDGFVGLADTVVVIQDKLKTMVPPWVPSETVLAGIDTDFFTPRASHPALRSKYGITEQEKVLVYHGGVNNLVRNSIKSLCEAVVLINERGIPCRLLRTGPYNLDFLSELPHKSSEWISELGVIPRNDLPDLLALADVFVQPGTINAFEDLRLPGKLPEFLAMGRPLIMPNVGIAYLFEDGRNIVLMKSGSAEEIASKCIELFSNPEMSERIGKAGRALVETFFDVRKQALALERVYKGVCEHFNSGIAEKVWEEEDKSIDLRLATKLKLIVNESFTSNQSAGEILKIYADYIGATQRRILGLEARITSLEARITNEATQANTVNHFKRGFASGMASIRWRTASFLDAIKIHINDTPHK